MKRKIAFTMIIGMIMMATSSPSFAQHLSLSGKWVFNPFLGIPVPVPSGSSHHNSGWGNSNPNQQTVLFDHSNHVNYVASTKMLKKMQKQQPIRVEKKVVRRPRK